MHEARSDISPSTAVLLEKSGKFFVYEPGLALIASDDSVDGAYQKFLAARREFLRTAELAGLESTRPASRPVETVRPQVTRGAERVQVAVGRSVAAELGMFLTKLFIVFLIIAGIGVTVSGLAPQVGISMVDVANKAAVIVQDLKAMPPDKKESLRQSIGTISRELDPIVDAWRNPPAKPGAPAVTGKPGQ